MFYQFFGETLQDQLKQGGEVLLFRETQAPISKLLQQYLILHGKDYLKQEIVPLLLKAAKKPKNYEVYHNNSFSSFKRHY